MGWLGHEDIRAKDGTRLALFKAKDPEVPKGDVILVHGFADHMGRYPHVADALVAAGWRVRGIDLRGHGVSDGKRGFVRQWSDYVDDLSAAIARSPTEPFILSHSMGGLVLLDLLREQRVRGAVIASPLLRAIVEAPKWKTASAHVLSRILPSMSLGNELHPEAVSRDPATQKAYGSDPLVFHSATPRWYTEMLTAQKRVIAHTSRYTTPALLMVGTGEKIVDPAPIEQMAREWGGPAELKTWAGFYHELFNEPERAEVLAHVSDWLAKAV